MVIVRQKKSIFKIEGPVKKLVHFDISVRVAFLEAWSEIHIWGMQEKGGP